MILVPEARGIYKITNKLGMHARAAAVFVQKAKEYAAEITLRKGDLEASGKSIMSISRHSHCGRMPLRNPSRNWATFT